MAYFSKRDFLKKHCMEDRRLPPRVLVETWLFLLESSETEEVRSRALEMLMSAFDNDMNQVVDYCREHKVAFGLSKSGDRACVVD